MLDNLINNVFGHLSSVWETGGELFCDAMTELDLMGPRKNGNLPAAGEMIVDEAKKYIGMAKSKMAGMDCSAFVRFVAKNTGNSIEKYIEGGRGPNGCSRLLNSMDRVSEEDAKNGDLVFFKLESGGLKTASHVGILVLGEDGSRQVLSMTNAGVRLNDFNDIAIRGTKITWGDRVIPDGYARLPQSGADFPIKAFT